MNSKQPLKPVRVTQGNILSRVRTAYKDNGFNYIINIAPHYIRSLFFTIFPNCFWLSYYRLFRSWETFEFQGNHYHYLFHAYCPSWKNERAAVIPIAWRIIQEYRQQNKEILEVGNMLSYIFEVNHDIIDKYEVTGSVINEDIADFISPKKYDLIISILTLQWVGLHESAKESTKVLRAISNLKKHLAPEGELVVIHGIGENPDMDRSITAGALRFNRSFYLKRISGYKWKEATWDDVKDSPYDHSIPTANGVLIGVIKNTTPQEEYRNVPA